MVQRPRRPLASLLLAASALTFGLGAPTTTGITATPQPTPATPTPAKDVAAAAPPNVVIILVDDLDWADVSTYGRRDAPTPNIDRIAQSGVAFSDAYVAASVCAVSRAALLDRKSVV